MLRLDSVGPRRSATHHHGHFICARLHNNGNAFHINQVRLCGDGRAKTRLNSIDVDKDKCVLDQVTLNGSVFISSCDHGILCLCRHIQFHHIVYVLL